MVGEPLPSVMCRLAERVFLLYRIKNDDFEVHEGNKEV